MKVLILSCSNGGGHNVIAEAVRDCYLAHGDECEVRDCFSFVSDFVVHCASAFHNFVFCHLPGLYGGGLRRAEENPRFLGEGSAARKLVELGSSALGRYILREGIEQVLCTHVFAGVMLAAAKKRCRLRVRTAMVETDHGNSPGGAKNDADFHFLPDASLIPGLLKAGVDRAKLVVSGVPVRAEICRRTGREEAKRVLGLDPVKPHVLMMGGSMGSGPFRELTRLLRARMGEGVQITVLCGSNRRLQRKLAAEFDRAEGVRIGSFTDNLSLLYDSADVIMTKPGGSTTAEAAVKELPMVLIRMVEGPEAHNLAFFLENGAAVTGSTPEELCDSCETLLRDGEAADRLRLALRRVASADAAEIIYRTMGQNAATG